MAEIAPTRSRTDPPSPEQHHQRSQKPHIPRRLHANTLRSYKGHSGSSSSGHHHHSHRSSRQHAKDTVQSAIELKPPINFENLLRRDKKYSPDSSRRVSGAPSGQQQGGGEVDGGMKRVRPEDVDKAKKENVRREEELRSNLRAVEEVGMSSTRQLDDTYYAILEKASILRSTVAGLQHLADESRRMHASFQEDTKKLEDDTERNVKSFGNFEQQEKKINGLVDQLQGSRERTDKLNERLESARLRVEAFEQRENENLAKRRTRWRLIWGGLVSFLVLIMAILLARNRRKVGLQLDVVGQQLVKLGDAVEDVAAPISSRLRPSPTVDVYLQGLFEDL